MTGLAHTRVLFVEGLPGTGKTTAAQRIQRRLQGRGIAASWWREESGDHPATPKELRRTASAPGFADRCLEHWRRFASEKRSAPELSILEGSAFQSSVRFLLEQDVARDEILAYVRAFARVVAPLAPRLVYLEPADAHVPVRLRLPGAWGAVGDQGLLVPFRDAMLSQT